MLEQESEPAVNENSANSLDEYQRLRSLMLGKDYEKVLKNRLEKENVERVSDVLTEAFKKRNSQDDSLAREMSPVIESAIDASIKRQPERITNVIYPIIGPAVRKAVASALTDLMQSLNYLLQNSLTARALIWRFKAWRLGVLYGQYALLQTIHYRVEQVFLIHRETGLLIQSAQADGINYQDPDLVSSMLTAITDFANDSFEQSTEGLEILQFGDLSLLIETGPHAVLAFAVRGTLHNEVKNLVSELTEQIHAQFAKELKNFEGDTIVFEPCHELLENALLKKEKIKTQSRPWLAIMAVTVVVMFVSYLVYKKFLIETGIQNTVDFVNQQQGYQVLSQTYDEQLLTLNVLKSPLAVTTQQLTEQLPTSDFIVKIKQNLASLDSAELYVPFLAYKYQIDLSTSNQGGDLNLIASGETTIEQLNNLADDPIVKGYFNLVKSNTLKFKPNRSNVEINRKKLAELVAAINNRFYYFEVASSVLTEASLSHLNETIGHIKQVLFLQSSAAVKISQIAVSGFADKQGGRITNIQLSEDRAKLIKSILLQNEIEQNLIISWGGGSKDLDSVPSETQRRARIEILFTLNEASRNDQ